MNVMKSKVDMLSVLWIQEFDVMNLHPNAMSFLYNLKGDEHFTGKFLFTEVL